MLVGDYGPDLQKGALEWDFREGKHYLESSVGGELSSRRPLFTRRYRQIRKEGVLSWCPSSVGLEGCAPLQSCRKQGGKKESQLWGRNGHWTISSRESTEKVWG